jgi:hypothetical protein
MPNKILFISTYSGFILCLFRYEFGDKPFIAILTVTHYFIMPHGDIDFSLPHGGNRFIFRLYSDILFGLAAMPHSDQNRASHRYFIRPFGCTSRRYFIQHCSCASSRQYFLLPCGRASSRQYSIRPCSRASRRYFTRPCGRASRQ